MYPDLTPILETEECKVQQALFPQELIEWGHQVLVPVGHLLQDHFCWILHVFDRGLMLSGLTRGTDLTLADSKELWTLVQSSLLTHKGCRKVQNDFFSWPFWILTSSSWPLFWSGFREFRTRCHVNLDVFLQHITIKFWLDCFTNLD